MTLTRKQFNILTCLEENRDRITQQGISQKRNCAVGQRSFHFIRLLLKNQAALWGPPVGNAFRSIRFYRNRKSDPVRISSLLTTGNASNPPAVNKSGKRERAVAQELVAAYRKPQDS